jgi:acetylglutamate kinase
MKQPAVLKLGGELLETADSRRRIGALVGAVATIRPIVIVHGGGRAIDADLDRRGIKPAKVDGLRITDPATLEAVISVLAGAANTALVAVLVSSGVKAVGLTGVDAGFGRAARAGSIRSTSGALVDLGLVGDPLDPDPTLVNVLLASGYVPVVASLGLERDGSQVLNVNADVMACRIAASLDGAELVIAGTTAGVLDGQSRSIPLLDIAGIDAIVGNGTATAGMVAKLTACRAALSGGVTRVRIVDGRNVDPAAGLDELPGTTIVAETVKGSDIRNSIPEKASSSAR